MMARGPHDTAFRDTVRDALLARAEDLFRQYIGEPVSAGSHDWRAKDRSSFSMKIRGTERGLWMDFVAGQGGDVFDFVAVHLCSLAKASDDFPKVLHTAANWAGVSHDQPIDRARLKARKAATAKDDTATDAAARQRRTEIPGQIGSKSQSVWNTPAATYLASRGITDLPETLLSFLPPVPELTGPGMAGVWHPSLVIWATDAVGLRTGGQRVLLGPDGLPARLKEEQVRKPVFGTTRGNPGRIPARVAGSPLCVAEGPESALSIWQATGYETWVVFGVYGFKPAPLPLDRRIILCPDQDAPVGTYPAGSREANLESAARTFAEAVEVHVAAGCDIWVARAPEPVGSKRDLNDTLQRAGNAAVAEAIAAATSARPAPFHPAPTEDRDAAIAAHAETVKTFLKDALFLIRATQAAKAECDMDDLPRAPTTSGAGGLAAQTSARPEACGDGAAVAILQAAEVRPAPRVMLTGAQGVGKTRALIPALQGACGVVSLILQPDHGMARQFVTDCNKAFGDSGPVVVHLRGRSALNPGGADGERMCLMPDVAERFAKAGTSVRKVLCTRCPMAHLCGHMRQEATIERLSQEPAGVVIVAPHEYAFLPLPGDMKPDLVVMDEAPRSLGVESVAISYDALSRPLGLSPRAWATSRIGSVAERAEAEAASRTVIQCFRRDLRDAFREHPTAPLQALRDRGYTAASVQDVLDELQMFEDSGMAARVAALIESHEQAQGQGTTTSSLEAGLSDLVADHDGGGLQAFLQVARSVLVELATERASANSLLPVADVNAAGVQGAARPGIRAQVLKPFHHGADTPFLHLDGTGDHALMEKLFGPMRHACHRVERNAETTQIMGRSFSVQSITGQRADGQAWGTAGDKRHKEATQLRAEIIAYCHRTPDALVVAPLKVIDALQADGLQNPVAHHGALRGRNDWEHLSSVIMISREQPTRAVEDIARAYAAGEEAPFQSLNGAMWSKAARVLRTRKGPPVTQNVDCHPDPCADRVLRQVRDASLCQGIDRIRPIYKEKPVAVTIMSCVALDITIDRTQAWVETKRGGPRLAQALQGHGVIPLSAREAHRLMPDIFPSRKTAQCDLDPVTEQIDALMAHSPNRDALFGERAGKDFTLCTYQLLPKLKQRMHRHEALVLGCPGEARAILEALTGPLRLFETCPKWQAALAALDLADTHARYLAGGCADTSTTSEYDTPPPASDTTSRHKGVA